MKIKGVAHRGYPVKYPENTLSSYQAAVDLGFEILELDAHLTKDGVPVLMHDPKLDRTTNGTGQIKDYTLKELKQLQVGEYETIPTLEEALQAMKGKIKVNVEIKQKGNLYPGIESIVLETIKKADMMDQVYASSFDHYAMMRLRKLSPDIDISLILSGATPPSLPLMKEIRAKYIAFGVGYITDEVVEDCERHEVTPVAWTVNSEAQIRSMLQYPSVLCTTDQCERFKAIYEEVRG
ncbi:glycerophosphoryl diester phosphodiesterase [Pullulanibacillus pueri]|uniref:Glycerophosphoryl diester phosphodiesterase n=1 Tax=Pullulanibacillus pueri TaxID=1437324 RepID=A0A8J3EL86_9BACL|nr:glycerophosphodiester phosphodiesterase family protein [Pullulanibacillus pueri]MBM7682092.1 glycerophosphoryl diester phosphodiesterase [Pullulanibacillus pueri]GGH80013.1 glycerophosphoryl diester phosphodiesterase [Pullulanibacillus pueri]